MNLATRIAVFVGSLTIIAAIFVGGIVLMNTIGEMIPIIVQNLMR